MPSINSIFKEAYIVLELKTEKLQKRKDLLKFMLNPDFDFVNKRYKKNYSELESFHNYAKLCHFFGCNFLSIWYWPRVKIRLY